MNRYFLFTNTDRELKLVNVDDLISITLVFSPHEQQFEIHIKGEAPQHFIISNWNKDLTQDDAVKLIKVMMYTMATQKHPVFDWNEFCKTHKGG